jgi:hypothetical protein
VIQAHTLTGGLIITNGEITDGSGRPVIQTPAPGPDVHGGGGDEMREMIIEEAGTSEYVRFHKLLAMQVTALLMDIADADLGQWSRKAMEVATLMNEPQPLAEVMRRLNEMQARGWN